MTSIAIHNFLSPLLKRLPLLFVIIPGILVLTCLTGCEPAEKGGSSIVARVGPYSLSKERIEQPYIYSLNPKDSIEAINQFIRQWAYDKAFEVEAIEQLEARNTLDQLIEAYRSSLLTHLFEKQLIEEELDSFISSDELFKYYEANKGQYILSSSIMRLHFIKVNKKNGMVGEIRNLWSRWQEESALDSLISICNEAAEAFLLEDSVWYKQEELQTFIPESIIEGSSATSFREQTFSNDTAMYFLRVLERIPDTEIAPLAFIEKQARKVILYRRKQALIREKRESIYREAIKNNRVKFYN